MSDSTPLPETVHLLSSKEVLELASEHRRELKLYAAKFNPQDESKAEILRLKEQLKNLELQFQELETERTRMQGQLEQCRILESQYVKNWQDLNKKIDEKYSEDLLKAKFEIQMKQLDDASLKLEKDFKKTDDLELFLQQYIPMRTEYHVKREKLATWNAQGELRIR